MSAPWETTLGRRIYGEPITSPESWLMIRVPGVCPTCRRPSSAPLTGDVRCPCGEVLHARMRARDASPLIPLAPPRST
jgi:hypothetical protein